MRIFATSSRWQRADWVFAVLTFAVTLACYWPALHGAPLWDDPAHITQPELRGWGGLLRIWTDVGATQEFYPVLHGAFWLQHRLWGDATLGYHLVNIFLHAGSCCVLVLVLRGLWAPRAPVAPGGGFDADRVVPLGAEWLAALLFAVHPVCVESVAWITEQKNTLSLFFCLLAAAAYLRHTRQPHWTNYNAALVLFFLALASKPSTVVLPAALLVLVWWRNGRLEWRRDIVPLLSFFALALAAGLVTVWVETHHVGAKGDGFDWSLAERVMLASRIVWFYLGKLVWPLELSFYYEHWDVSARAAGWWPFLAAAVALTVALWAVRRRARGPLAVWLLFVGTLFPVLGFFNVYGFTFSQVADHFQYLSCMVFLAAAAGSIAIMVSRLPDGLRTAAWGAIGVVLIGLGVHARNHSALYVDNETLFRSVIARNPKSWMAHHILGIELSRMPGRGDEALVHMREAIRFNPDFPDAHFALGVELMKQPGSRQEALAEYRRALQLRPYYAEAHSALALELAKEPGRLEDAVRHFEEALKVRPLRPEIHANYANALARDPARIPKAIARFEEALHLKPDYTKALNDYGVVLARLPDHRLAALSKFERALSLEPGYHEARYNLAATLAEISGREAEAVSQYERILQADPAFALAHYGIANVFARDPRRAAEAVTRYETALRIQPGFAEAHANLANVLAQHPERFEDTVTHYEAALRIDPSLHWVHFNLAMHLARKPDRAAEAVSHFEAALRINPTYLDALNGLAILLAQQGRYEEARARWTRALEIDPRFETARQNLLLLEQMRTQPR